MSARWWAQLVGALGVVAAVPTVVLLAIGPDRSQPAELFAGAGGVAFVLLALTFLSVGVLVATRVPTNRIGVIFCITGFGNIAQLLTWQYADVGLHPAGRLPGAAAAATANAAFGEVVAPLLGIAILLFPTGRLPTRQWWPALASLGVAVLLLEVSGLFRPGRYDAPFASVSNPFGIAGTRGVLHAADTAGWLFVLVGLGQRSHRSVSADAEPPATSAAGSTSCSPSGRLRRPWPRR